jgi:hypothetical protein
LQETVDTIIFGTSCGLFPNLTDPLGLSFQGSHHQRSTTACGYLLDAAVRGSPLIPLGGKGRNVSK